MKKLAAWEGARTWIALEFKPADLWVGMFWRASPARRDLGDIDPADFGDRRIDIWVCLVPCLPIHVTLWRAWWWGY